MSKQPSRKQQRQQAKAQMQRLKQIRLGGAAVIIVLAITGLALWRNADAVPTSELATQIEPNLDGPAQLTKANAEALRRRETQEAIARAICGFSKKSTHERIDTFSQRN